MASQTGRTKRSENPPFGSLGVATTINVIFVSRTACSISRDAVSRPADACINSGNPGSNTGGRPSLIALTLSSSESTPMTRNQREATATAFGAPSFPNPATLIPSVIVPPDLDAPEDCFCCHAHMPTQQPLQCMENSIRQPSKIPFLNITILLIFFNPIGKDVIGPYLLDVETVPFHQIAEFGLAIGIRDWATGFRLGVSGHELR